METMPLQDLCERGQELLVDMKYWPAEKSLSQAEQIAREMGDFDTLGRLYMPLQECRRQRRQRCGEGVVRMNWLAKSESDQPVAEDVIQQNPHGQLLLAGWGSLAPAKRLREIAREKELFVETFLGAVYPAGENEYLVVIVPEENVSLPPVAGQGIDQLARQLPPHCIMMNARELPATVNKGTAETFGRMMDLWERLHLPYLSAAQMTRDPKQKIDAFRRTIEVDYACELAHQQLSDTARTLGRGKRKG